MKQLDAQAMKNVRGGLWWFFIGPILGAIGGKVASHYHSKGKCC